MNTIGTGLIGCGGRLRVVVRRLMAHHDGQLKRVGMYAPPPTMVEAARTRQAPVLRAHDTDEDLVRDPAIDWVMIGSWNGFPAARTIAAFDTWARPVYENIETGATGGNGGGFTAAITCFGIDEAINTGRVVNMADYWQRADAQP